MAGSANPSPWIAGTLQDNAASFLNDWDDQGLSFSEEQWNEIEELANRNVDPSLIDFNPSPEFNKAPQQEHDYDGCSTTANDAPALQTTADNGPVYQFDNFDNNSVASGVGDGLYDRLDTGMPTTFPCEQPSQLGSYHDYGTWPHPQYSQPYGPFYSYPEQGLAGRYELHQPGPAMENPYLPKHNLTYGQYTNQWNQRPLAPIVPSSLEPVGACMSCGCKPHTGRCPSPTLPQHPLRLPEVSQVESQGAAKRKWSHSYDDTYSPERATKVPRRSPQGRNAKNCSSPGKDKRGRVVDVSLVYTQRLDQVPNWTSKQGFEFSYTRQGQWEQDIILSAEQLRDYINSCPRQLTIWLQHVPAQSSSRVDKYDSACRYEGCPVPGRTMLMGWFRVVFDEFTELTSTGIKDPFKMAGSMHLWCLERCIDPVELFNSGVLEPDKRILPEEDMNRMAANRQSDIGIIRQSIEPWIETRRSKGGPPQIPCARHEDSLSYVMVKHHIDHQTRARQRTRDRRNGDKPEENRKTIEYHLGRLDLFHLMCKNERRRKQGLPELPYEDSDKNNNDAFTGGEAPDVPPSIDDATDTPLTEEEFDEYIAPYTTKSNDTYAPAEEPQAEQTRMATNRFPTPKSPVLKAEDAINVPPSPPHLDHSKAIPLQTNRAIVSPSDLFSPESVEVNPPPSSVSQSQESASSGAAANEQPGSKPESNGQVVAPPPMTSNLMFPSAPVKQGVQGSPLRRSSRVSAKKTP
ncbi:hypothetical protein FSARC_7702 [Fusarium sarcochroum]|uniref:Uncharacterized protein n=1 Tax=Fusarium sarcochroum TaxID=1208366 RepID=A0A8H4TUJ7_9HYPO|nr:hypothetical protein FSARC_7702 [Fusarium sarcochroum]